MRVKITDSKDIRRVFTKVKDDSEGKAVKKLLRMFLGKPVKDSTIGNNFKIVVYNQNKRPEMLSNVLKNKSDRDKFRDMISSVKYDAEELASAVNTSGLSLYKWKPDKNLDEYISIKSKDWNGNEFTMKVVKQ